MMLFIFILLLSSSAFGAQGPIAILSNPDHVSNKHEMFYFKILQAFHAKNSKNNPGYLSPSSTDALTDENIAYLMQYLASDENRSNFQVFALPYTSKTDDKKYYANALYTPQDDTIHLFDHLTVDYLPTDKQVSTLIWTANQEKIENETKSWQKLFYLQMSGTIYQKIIDNNTQATLLLNNIVYCLNRLRLSVPYTKFATYLRSNLHERNQGTNFLSIQTWDNDPMMKNNTLINSALATRG